MTDRTLEPDTLGEKLPPMTPEQSDVDDTVTAADDIYVPEPIQFGPDEEPSSRRSLRALPEPDRETKKEDKAKATPPRVDEWQAFFSRVVRGMCNGYIEMCFRGVDEDLLSDREIDSLKITQDERDRIAKPPAEFANKFAWTRKHGRLIISAGGLSDSFIALLMWMRRVNRIARKYKTRTIRGNVSPGPNEQAAQNGTGSGFVPGQYYSPGG